MFTCQLQHRLKYILFLSCSRTKLTCDAWDLQKVISSWLLVGRTQVSLKGLCVQLNMRTCHLNKNPRLCTLLLVKGTLARVKGSIFSQNFCSEHERNQQVQWWCSFSTHLKMFLFHTLKEKKKGCFFKSKQNLALSTCDEWTTGLQHVIFIPLPAVDLLCLTVLYAGFVAYFSIFRKFLKSTPSIMHLLSPLPNLMCHSPSLFPVFSSRDSNQSISRH